MIFRYLACVLCVISMGCGGSKNPVTSTPPAKKAVFTADSQIHMDCTFAGASTFCTMSMGATNTGDGCGMNVLASVTFFDADKNKVATASLGTDPPSKRVQPGETATMSGGSTDYGMRSAKSSSTSFTFDSCQ